MNDVLKQIIENKSLEVAAAATKVPLTALKAFIESMPPCLDFAKALHNPGRKHAKIIAECKKRSPSRGVLVTNYDPVELAKRYEDAGASCVSVLSDTKYFGGSLKDISAVKQSVNIPVLRKDFIIDEYQIYETRRAGADSFLLIAGVLDVAQLQYFLEIGRELGMEALVETHSQEEIDLALKTDCKILGINNRDLKTMQVDTQRALLLAGKIVRERPDLILVCESGMSQAEQIRQGLAQGFSAFLIGETLVTSSDPEATLRQLLS